MRIQTVHTQRREWRWPNKPVTAGTKLFGMLAGGVGVVLLAWGVFRLADAVGLLVSGRTAEATVTFVEARGQIGHGSATHASIHYVLTVAFDDARGEPTEATIETGSAFSEGETVTVIHPPGQPKLAQLKGFWRMFGVTTLLIAAGLPLSLLFLGGALAMLGYRRGPARSNPQAADDHAETSGDPDSDFPLDLLLAPAPGSAPGTAPGSVPGSGPGVATTAGWQTVRRRERYTFTDPKTGETREYDSLGEMPEAEFNRFADMQREVFDHLHAPPDGATTTFKWTDDAGVEHTAYRLEDVPPKVRAMFENLGGFGPAA